MNIRYIVCALLLPLAWGCSPGSPGSDNGIPSGSGVPPVDRVLTIDDGTYAGSLTQVLELTTSDGQTTETTSKRYLIAEVSGGSVTSLRLGSAAVGLFKSIGLSAGATFEDDQTIGNEPFRLSLSVVSSGASVITFSLSARPLQPSGSPGDVEGTGDGFLAVSVAEGLQLHLHEHVTFTAGPLAGQSVTSTAEGSLSPVPDVPAPTDPGSGQPTPEPGSGPSVPTPDKPLELTNSGSEVLADGSVRTYSGTRNTSAIETETIASTGEQVQSLQETLTRTFTAGDGSTSQETNTSKVYFGFNNQGLGRILGYQENGKDRFIIDPVGGVPGGFDSLVVGATRQYTATYDDGTVDVFSETITGTAQVILPSGTFNVFTTESHLKRTRPDGTEETSTVTASLDPTRGVLQRHVVGSIRFPDGTVKTTEFDDLIGS